MQIFRPYSKSFRFKGSGIEPLETAFNRYPVVIPMQVVWGLIVTLGLSSAHLYGNPQPLRCNEVVSVP
jgi:hypothetical protein